MSWWSGRRARALIAVPVTVVLLLAGCTGGTPTATESTTTPPVETPTPTPTPTLSETPVVDVTVKPERPAALDEPPSVDGAVAVAEYALGLYGYAYATGDLADWQAISDVGCVFCSSVTTNVQAMHAKGHKQVESGTVIHRANGIEVAPATFYTVDIDARQGAAVELDGSGSIVGEGVAGEFSLFFAVEWSDGWKVREVDISAAEQ